MVPATLVGQSDSHLCSDYQAARVGARVHRELLAPLALLRDAAAREGFDLTIVSGFRSFDRQLSIWNRKATGALPVLDSAGAPIDIATLSERDLVLAILRWSALPGASRHHWGTDVDVYDRAATPDGYNVELTPAEVDPGGLFAPLHAWLDARIAADDAFGFFRPYDVDRGGVAPERWHLSYAPIALNCARLLTAQLLDDAIDGADMRLKDVVIAALPELFERFVINTNRRDD